MTRAGAIGTGPAVTRALALLLPGSRKRRPHAITVGNGLSQHAAELSHIHVSLAASDHEGTVVLEVVAPGDDLLVRPAGRILAHLLVRHTVHVGSQINAGFVGTFVHKRLLLEIPNGLLHSGHYRIANPQNHTTEITDLKEGRMKLTFEISVIIVYQW